MRREHDFYPTPRFPVIRLLEQLNLPTDVPWLEPCVGNGALLRHCASFGVNPEWHTNDIRAVDQPDGSVEHSQASAATWLWHWRYANGRRRRGICFSNPPFNQAEGIVAAAVGACRIVVMLLPTSWMGTQDRAEWLRENTPAAYHIPERISFTGEGSASQNYAWLIWGLGHSNNVFLNDTPLAERRADEAANAGTPTAQRGLFEEVAA